MPTIAPTFLAAASAPSPIASEWRTSRAKLGKTVMLEKPNTSPTMTTTAISATSRFRAMSVIERLKLGGVAWLAMVVGSPSDSATAEPEDRAGERRHQRCQHERDPGPGLLEHEPAGDRADEPEHERTDRAKRDRIRDAVRAGEVEGVGLARGPTDRVERPDDQAQDDQRRQAELPGAGQRRGAEQGHHAEHVRPTTMVRRRS